MDTVTILSSMHATIYVGDRQTRVAGWSVLGALTLLALTFNTWALSTPPDSAGIMVRQAVGAVVIAGIVVLAAVRVGPFVGSTMVSASGITVRTLLRDRSIAWSDVRSIGVVRPGGGRSQVCVMERSRAGQRCTVLPGVLATRAHQVELDQEARAIAALWTRAMGEPQER